MTVILCVPGSELSDWRRASRGAFEVVKAATWPEALAESSIDAGFVFFHLAERLGLTAAEAQSVVHERRGGAGPRYWVTSPKLPIATTRDPEATIRRFVVEALVAVAAHNERADPSRTISAIGFMGADLGGHSNLSIAARARAVADAVAEYDALLAPEPSP